MWTCDRKRVYRNSGEGSRKASGRSQMGIVGLSGLRTTSGAGQMTCRSPSAEFCSPLRQALWGDAATSEPSSTVGPRRAQLIGGKWVEKECCRLCHPSSAIRSDLHSIKSDRALIKPSNLPMAMRKKGKKVHADYDNFLLGCDFSSLW